MLTYYQSPETIECGIDEAGRGCLSGPVVAAAVILPKGFSNKLLNDSKQLSHKKRKLLREIIEREALAFSVSFVDNNEIDEINILQASFLAMTKAAESLRIRPEILLIDGNRFKSTTNIPHICIVKGDTKYQSIAAASILAKTYRDDYMEELAKEYPHYSWHKNKGYPTKDHRKAIKDHGISPFHRKTFNLLGKPTLFE
ncbi:MAG: ribonuclease HII [Bacteroidales bacterium]|nr:ribonuclease HII [Bacteroidales bacterium]MDD4684586.1 ribonuclease HII [Bacteroidales bacterium]